MGSTRAIPRSPGPTPGSIAAGRRHPRPGTGSFHRYGYGYRYAYPYYRHRPCYGFYPSFGFFPFSDVYDSDDYGYDGYDYGLDNDPRAATGELRLDAHPEDASVYVDGVFRGRAGEVRSLSLPSGTHHIEIVRPGFREFSRDVPIRGREPAELEVDLERD